MLDNILYEVNKMVCVKNYYSFIALFVNGYVVLHIGMDLREVEWEGVDRDSSASG